MNDSDKPKCECGVIAVQLNGSDAAEIVKEGLFDLQIRGQESVGIATADGREIYLRKTMGLVACAFPSHPNYSLSLELPGSAGIGHNRYSTTGGSKIENAQPFRYKNLALAHNGNLINAHIWRKKLEDLGYAFESTTDSEVILKLLDIAPGSDLVKKLCWVMKKISGAYSIVILTKEGEIFAARDPLGIRPLCLGEVDGGAMVVSESCVIENIEKSKYLGDVRPGEIIKLSKKGKISRFPAKQTLKERFCILELIYFANSDSIMKGRQNYMVRVEMGKQLAKESPVQNADVVICTPESSRPHAIGYAEGLGVPYCDGLVKNPQALRSFIAPDQRARDEIVRRKFKVIKEIVDGKVVVIVDDSLIRATTTPKTIKLLKKAGAKEVHLRISSPPVKNPCFYGIDMGTKEELIFPQLKSVKTIESYIGCDSLSYLSLEGLVKAVDFAGVGLNTKDFCTACFSGDYPIPLQANISKLMMEKC